MSNRLFWQCYKRLPLVWQVGHAFFLVVMESVIFFYVWILFTDKPMTTLAGAIGLLAIFLFFGWCFSLAKVVNPIAEELRKEGWK